MTICEKLAEFTAGVKYEDLPVPVIQAAKERILDTVGAVIAGYANWEYSSNLREACRFLGTGDAGVIGGGRQGVPTAVAAMIHAVYAHAVELDDGHKNAGCHAGAVVVPTALALAQELRSSGTELIEAVTVGYEATYRIAVAMNPAQIKKGFHPSSNCGVFGAAAAAGKLLKLPKEQIADGLGQAGMFACGTMEATVSGQRSKCVQVGQAALNGIMAARLAQTGMEGCRTCLEGRNGLFRLQSEGVDAEAVCRDLGDVYLITDTYNKMYPTCRHAQPGIEAAADLAVEHGIRPQDIEKIEIGTHQVAYDLTGVIKTPKNSGEAKFSLAYGAAVAVQEHGFGVKHLTEPYYTAPELSELAALVDCYVAPEVQEKFPQRRGARVMIALKDGRRFEKELYDLKGSPGNPVGLEELVQKFRMNAEGVLEDGRAAELEAAIRGLENLADAGSLTELLR